MAEGVSIRATPLGTEGGNNDFVYMCLCTYIQVFIHVCTLVSHQLAVVSSLLVTQT